MSWPCHEVSEFQDFLTHAQTVCTRPFFFHPRAKRARLPTREKVGLGTRPHQCLPPLAASSTPTPPPSPSWKCTSVIHWHIKRGCVSGMLFIACTQCSISTCVWVCLDLSTKEPRALRSLLGLISILSV